MSAHVVIDPDDLNGLSGVIERIEEEVESLGKDAKITGLSIEWKANDPLPTTYTLSKGTAGWALMVAQP